MVEEPSPEGALECLRGLRARYEAHHGVYFTDSALKAAVTSAHRQAVLPGCTASWSCIAFSDVMELQNAFSVFLPAFGPIPGEIYDCLPLLGRRHACTCTHRHECTCTFQR